MTDSDRAWSSKLILLNTATGKQNSKQAVETKGPDDLGVPIESLPGV